VKAFNLLVLYSIAILFPAIGYAEDTSLVVSDAWIREAPPNAVALAGYMIMENPSNKELSLVSATSDSFENVMIHRTVHEGGMARMKHQKAVAVPANKTITFEPNGYHLMLMNPKQPVRAGDQISVNLILADDSKIKVGFDVRKGAPEKGGMKCGAGKCGAGKSGGSKGGMRCGAGKCGGM
jgi:copper(I)-binding protein